ncbi:hypothetical protein ACIGXM_06450 [Kitasatospora sp. NPDC052896]|uniref:hypothetical protein n=1 Tax=Kitasatospora sp. NPDC052896 TaxID=3364061 RepID=UPI0037C97EF1
MAPESWNNPRLSEDLELVPESGGPRDYAARTDGPVTYLVVANAEGVLGYLWANDADDAAGFVPREAGGDDAYNAWGAWDDELRRRKERDLPPSRALAELAEIPGGVRWGRVVPGAPTQAPSLPALRELAAHA